MSDDPVEQYLAGFTGPARRALTRARATIRKALPGSSEAISYRIPIFKVEGRMVLFLAGFAGHYSVYPATKRLLSELAGALQGRLHGRGTLRFSYAEPVPVELITRIARVRAAEAAEHQAARKKPATKAAPGKGAPKKPKPRPTAARGRLAAGPKTSAPPASTRGKLSGRTAATSPRGTAGRRSSAKRPARKARPRD